MGKPLKNQIKNFIVETLEKNIELVKGSNAIYSDSEFFLVLSWAGINQISIQESAEQLKEMGYTVPSVDTILNRLSNQPYHILEKGFDKSFQSLLSKAAKRHLFNRPVVVAIDLTDIEWYGEDLPFIVISKTKNGTNRFIRFATIAIVEDGKRFTLKVLPITPFSNRAKIVKQLVEYARRFVDIRVILMDRGFYSNEVIKTIKAMEVSFLLPAVKNEKVKRKMEEAFQKGPMEYEMSDGVTYILSVIKDEEKDRLLPYATNMRVDPQVLHELYTKRFGIETQYRVKNRFLGRTCSKQYSVRYCFFTLAVCLYNIWILLNIAERGRNGLEPGKIPIRVDRLKHIFRKIVYRMAPE